MDATTLEQYFIEDYKRLKAENDDIKAKLAAFEANAGNHEYGITDLHQRFKAIRGSVIESYYVRARLKDGKLKPEAVRSWIELDDESLFAKTNGKSADYTRILDYEEHEFQYTLMVKESRTEWVAVSDGNKNSKLETIYDGDFSEGDWYDAARSDDFKRFLAQELRCNLREGLADWEKEQASKEEEGE